MTFEDRLLLILRRLDETIPSIQSSLHDLDERLQACDAALQRIVDMTQTAAAE